MNDPTNPQVPGAPQPVSDDQPLAPRSTCGAVVEVLKLALLVAGVFGTAWLAIIAWTMYEVLHR